VIRKLLLAPWFGPLPTWYRLWFDNISRLGQFGFDVYVTQDQHDFNARVKATLGIENAIGDDGRKVCDYRCAFGLLYADLIDGYDFWGHTDLDMVYGRVERYVTDDFLDGLELHSNHPTYVSGPWSLYGNDRAINELFMQHEDWRGYLENPATTGWVETAFSDLVVNLGVVHEFTNWQTRNLDNFDSLHWDGDKLMEGRDEVMVAHFRRTKEYPKGLL
jgi:hypothetical protein